MDRWPTKCVNFHSDAYNKQISSFKYSTNLFEIVIVIVVIDIVISIVIVILIVTVIVTQFLSFY